MGIIKGQNMRVLVGTSGTNKCIGLAVSSTITISAETSDISTKDSTGSWSENDVVALSWSASTDALMSVDTDSDAQLFTNLKTLMLSMTPVTLVWDITNSTKNRTPTNSAAKMTGTALITSVDINSANKQNVQYTVQFTGTGALS